MRPARTGGVLAALAAGLLLALLAEAAPAQPDDETEKLAAVKAAFVYNFIKLVGWPQARLDGALAPIHVCVIQGDAMDESLRHSLQHKTFDGHALQVLPLPLAAADLLDCHVLYLGAAQQPQYAALMARAVERGVLVIDEGASFSWPDGMIRLFLDQGRVHFELNPQAVERAGLKLDPRLIRLARIATR